MGSLPSPSGCPLGPLLRAPLPPPRKSTAVKPQLICSLTLPSTSIWGSEQSVEDHGPEHGRGPTKATQHVGQSRGWNPSLLTPCTAPVPGGTFRDSSEPKSVAESRPSTDGLFLSTHPSLPRWWELPQAVNSLWVPDTSLINSFQLLWACPGLRLRSPPSSRLRPVQQLHAAGHLACLPGHPPF